MKIRVRLYHYHDLDLVSLYREGRISISKAIKCTLKAFAQKKYMQLEVGSKKCEKTAKPVYMFNVILNEEKDQDAIELLNKIENGYRNNFIKQLLREYLCFTIPDCYTSSENKSYISECVRCIVEEYEARSASVKECLPEKCEISEEKTMDDENELVAMFKNMLF